MRYIGPALALLMIVGGVYLTVAGLGWVGSGQKSAGLANGGAVLAGLGVALAYVSLKRPAR